MTTAGLTFQLDEERDAWKSESKVSYFGDELEVWLSADGDADFTQQGEILAAALQALANNKEEVQQRLFDYYQEACHDFGDLEETELLPKIDSPDSVTQLFGFSVLEIPMQFPGQGATFKIVGGCSWNENDGVQLFFRNGKLEQVDSDTAFLI